MGILDEIKKNATKQGVKVQTSEEEAIEKMLNNLFYLDKDIPNELKFLKYSFYMPLLTSIGMIYKAFSCYFHSMEL